MPIYEFHCDACDKDFDHRTTMESRDTKVACPDCGSKKTGRKLSIVAVGNNPQSQGASAGHVHSGGCGCGKSMGSCGMN